MNFLLFHYLQFLQHHRVIFRKPLFQNIQGALDNNGIQRTNVGGSTREATISLFYIWQRCVWYVFVCKMCLWYVICMYNPLWVKKDMGQLPFRCFVPVALVSSKNSPRKSLDWINIVQCVYFLSYQNISPK